MASPGTGTQPHLAGELFKTMAGINMMQVPYRGAGPAIIDLIAGQVDVVFTAPFPVIEYIRAGKLRALAVTTTTGSEALPDEGARRARRHHERSKRQSTTSNRFGQSTSRLRHQT